MTTRYIYKSPISGRKSEFTLAQILHPELADLGECSALTGNLLAILVDKGYLALYEALQIAGVPPGAVKVEQPQSHPCYDEHQPGCDCPIPEQKATPTPPFLERMVSNPVGDIAVSALQHRQDVDWLISHLEQHARERSASSEWARIRRLQSFLREELLR